MVLFVFYIATETYPTILPLLLLDNGQPKNDIEFINTFPVKNLLIIKGSARLLLL